MNPTKVPSYHDIQNVARICTGYGDWYDAQLLRLIRKGDAEEFARLEQVYPAHTDLVKHYRQYAIVCRSLSSKGCTNEISEWCPSCRTYYCDDCILTHSEEEQED